MIARRNINLRQSCAAQRGASILIALLFFLVCALVGSVVLTSATVSSGQLAALKESQQAYYSVTSAAELFRDVIEDGTGTAQIQNGNTTWKCTLPVQSDGANDSAVTSFEKWLASSADSVSSWLKSPVGAVSSGATAVTATRASFRVEPSASSTASGTIVAVSVDAVMRADYSLWLAVYPADYNNEVGAYRVVLEIPAAKMYQEDESTVEAITWENAIIRKPAAGEVVGDSQGGGA